MNYCGKCNLSWHQPRDSDTGFCGQIWNEEVGYHPWTAPTKDQIKERLRIRYGLVQKAS